MATECYWRRSQILRADSPKVLRLKSKQRSLVYILCIKKKKKSQTDGDTHVKDPVTVVHARVRWITETPKIT